MTYIYGLSVVIKILSPRGCLPCPGASYMYKSIKIYTRTRCQVSVYRTTGPLVWIWKQPVNHCKGSLWIFLYNMANYGHTVKNNYELDIFVLDASLDSIFGIQNISVGTPNSLEDNEESEESDEELRNIRTKSNPIPPVSILYKDIICDKH